jgi:hypothetical protein
LDYDGEVALACTWEKAKTVIEATRTKHTKGKREGRGKCKDDRIAKDRIHRHQCYESYVVRRTIRIVGWATTTDDACSALGGRGALGLDVV